ncbi:MAG: chemotaxis protein CheA [Desulfobacterales bacterium]|nr:chemotaxis protein CheA [Desulfobacterales bacterium]MBF0396658.1 chemotaxis protein CheA [Desulfobacterales bacterium]
MTTEFSDFRDDFKHEAQELLPEIQECILSIEEDSNNKDAIHRLFRAMHTLKGVSAMVGYNDISQFTHHIENTLLNVREETIPVTKDLINLLLVSQDQIKMMIDGEGKSDSDLIKMIIASFDTLLPSKKEQKVSPIKQESQKQRTYDIKFKPYTSMLTPSGIYLAQFLNEISALGECTIKPQPQEIPEEINPNQCYLSWDIKLKTTADLLTVKNSCDSFKTMSETNILEESLEAQEDHIPKIGEILIERGQVDPEYVDEAVEYQEKIKKVINDSKEQKIPDGPSAKTNTESVRVSSQKLDHLLNIVGELVIAQAQLNQSNMTSNKSELSTAIEQVERLTGELRDCMINIRMLPIGTTFNKFKRLIRDLSNELGKEIDLITEGGETELDKTVIEKLFDPLVHIIRNSADHGIENPDKRIKNGKAKKGSICLNAAHRGSNIVITIKDDGAGLDQDAIRLKAIEKGIISKDTQISEKDIYSLIFAPGFSTSEKVTKVSGRGVGMDVVKRSIDALRGTIQIETEKGKGTCLSLFLPLTLAIIDGLLIEAGKNFFVLPLEFVEECLELSKETFAMSDERNIIALRGQLIPYFNLQEAFNLSKNKSHLGQIVIVNFNNNVCGIVVDEIIGNYQAVIKPLGDIFYSAEGVSGATILGDGTVALILDIPKITQYAVQKEKEFVSQKQIV